MFESFLTIEFSLVGGVLSITLLAVPFTLIKKGKKGQQNKNEKFEERDIKDLSIVSRFVQIFESHGVCRNNIPRFFGHDLKIKDILNNQNLSEVLTDEMLDDACEIFGVNRGWLNGTDSEIYNFYDFYKDPQGCKEFVNSFKGDYAKLLIPSEVDFKKHNRALLVFEEPISEMEDIPAVRYHICKNWNYTYWKSRVYLSVCIALAWNKKIYTHTKIVSPNILEDLADGNAFFNKDIMWFRGSSHHAEDLLVCPECFLEDINPEINGYGYKSALKMWLEYYDNGWLQTDLPYDVRERFEAELNYYQNLGVLHWKMPLNIQDFIKKHKKEDLPLNKYFCDCLKSH